MPIFAWNVPLVSLIFLKRSLVFPILFLLFLCTDHQGRLSYLSFLLFGTLYSDEYIFPFLLCLSFLFLSQLFVRPPRTTILRFCISFSWGWFWLHPPIQCYEPPSIVLQPVYQISPLESICQFYYLIIRDLIQVIVEWPSGFPYFLQFNSEFCNKEFMIWAIVSSWSCFLLPV